MSEIPVNLSFPDARKIVGIRGSKNITYAAAAS